MLMPNTLSSWCLLVQVIQHDVGVFAPAQFDDDPHAVLVGLVAQLGNALESFVADQVGDLLDQPGLVYLVGQFRER